jgi:hypothetical protein
LQHVGRPEGDEGVDDGRRHWSDAVSHVILRCGVYSGR